MNDAIEWTSLARTFGLFTVTAVAELLGCYLPMLWLSNKGSAWLLLPPALSLLSSCGCDLASGASGRVYARMGIYIPRRWLAVAGGGVTPAWTDVAGVAMALPARRHCHGAKA